MAAESLPISNINLKELETSFMNSPVVAPFCVSWSKDNKISVIVEGGVFIFELLPMQLTEQQTITFARSWIPANGTTPLSDAVVDNENGSFLWSLSRKQVYEVTLDSTLCHAVQKPNGNSVFSYVVMCEFSPLFNSKSYIACLTNNGVLEIYKNSLKKWIPVINITQLWITRCNYKMNFRKVNFDSFKSKISKLKIVTMKWIEESDIYLMTGHEDGDLVLWETKLIRDSISVSVKNVFKVEGKPIHLHWDKIPDAKHSYLLVGLSSGVVKCLSVDLKTGAIANSFDLWKYEDQLLPSRIVTTPLFSNLFVFVVKRHVLLIQFLSGDEPKDFEPEPHCEEFPSAITGWSEYQDSFVVCLQNHDVYFLTLKQIDNLITFNKTKVETGIKKKYMSSHCCYGLTMSQNKVIWVLISSPKVNYNSLKDVTHMIMFTPEVKVFQSLNDKTSSGLIKKILDEYKDIHLNDIFDLLELKKLELLTDAEKFQDNYDVNEDLALVHLQLALWEVKLKLFCNHLDQESLVQDLEFSITRNRAKKVIAALKKSDSLNSAEEKSLDVCEMFLTFEKETNKSLNETCTICGSQSFLYNIRISSCSNLHKFPRCCLSLLPCDAVPYAVCRNCDSVALINFVVEGDNRCPYCDGLLESDTRFRNGV